MNDECTPKIIMSSPAACPVISMTPLWKWVENHFVLLALFFAATGISLLAYGGKHYMVSLFVLVSMNATFLLTSAIFGLIMP